MFTRKSIPRLFRIRLPGGIAARLAIAMYGLTLLMILALVGIIAVFIRERFASSTDSDLMHHAHALQVRLINEERFAADDALTIARLDGLDNAVAADDAATMARLVLPLKVSRELDSIYIVDSSLRVLLSMGESMTDGNALAHLPLIQRCFEDKAASSPLELNGSIWLVAAAAHVVAWNRRRTFCRAVLELSCSGLSNSKTPSSGRQVRFIG